MGQRLEGKVAIVFGAGSIGREPGNGATTAVVYARHGARVLCVDRSLEAAHETASLIEQEGGIAWAVKADVQDRAQIEAVRDECIERYGYVDILHNNVGVWELSEFEQITEESWDRVMAINVKGCLLTCQVIVPHLVERRTGSVINISSIAGKRSGTTPFFSYYASKAALNHLTRVLAKKYARSGVRFNAILPGLIDTPHAAQLARDGRESVEELRIARNTRCPMGTQGTAMDVAYAALFLASDESRYVTGLELIVDGGLGL